MNTTHNRAERRALQAKGCRIARAADAAGVWGPWEPRAPPDPRDWPELRSVAFCWVNDLYSVQVARKQCAWGEVLHLMIRRHDGAQVHRWSDLQRIKDELVGAERVAVEVYPERSRLVDVAPMYHLWVLPVGFVLPFDLNPMPRAEASRG